MKWIRCLVGAVLLVSSGFAARSQETTAGTPQKTVIKKAPLKTTGYSGEEIYREYCAVCHGRQGKGDGPAASALKVAPPDLSTLATRNNGKYPSDHVAAVLRFGAPAPAHGTSDMPVWGPLLGWSPTRTDPAAVQLRISNLTAYIESLQSK